MPNQHTAHPKTVAQRLIGKAEQRGNCWEWTGSKTSEGYGFFYFDGATRRAHRVIYELIVGPIPEGLQLDHLCRNTSCINPAHLEPVTARENTLRGSGAGGNNARKTHCVRGHELSGENLRWSSSHRHPSRRCKECALIRGRESYRRLKEQESR